MLIESKTKIKPGGGGFIRRHPNEREGQGLVLSRNRRTGEMGMKRSTGLFLAGSRYGKKKEKQPSHTRTSEKEPNEISEGLFNTRKRKQMAHMGEGWVQWSIRTKKGKNRNAFCFKGSGGRRSSIPSFSKGSSRYKK